jgi:hypothetical protein
MLEKGREYPAAITLPLSSDPGALGHAVTWIAMQDRELGCVPLLYAPGKRNLEYDPAVSRVAKAMAVATWRTLGSLHWGGGVVLALWPDREHLGVIADDRRTRALVVIPDDDQEAAPWATAVNAVYLGAQAAPAAGPAGAGRPVRLDPVVVQGLLTLTMLVNHGNNLAGTADHRDAVAVLLTLHDGGYALPADQVYEWALVNGWPSRGAGRLSELAGKIAKGTRPRLKGPWPLRDDILETWRSEALQNAG